MQTFLIISKDKNSWTSYIENFQKKQGIEKVDCTFLSQEGSFGIENVRNLQKNIILKPLRSKEKILVIENFQTATLESQNSMLKILEEPPINTTIFLISSSEENLIPTVLSRSSIIKLDDRIEKISEGQAQTVQKLLDTLTGNNISAKLKFAQELSANKEECLTLIKQIIYSIREKMIESFSIKDVENIKKLQKTYILASSSNVNLRFLLENTFLNINL